MSSGKRRGRVCMQTRGNYPGSSPQRRTKLACFKPVNDDNNGCFLLSSLAVNVVWKTCNCLLLHHCAFARRDTNSLTHIGLKSLCCFPGSFFFFFFKDLYFKMLLAWSSPPGLIMQNNGDLQTSVRIKWLWTIVALTVGRLQVFQLRILTR